MKYWETGQFWLNYIVLLVLSVFFFALPGAILLNEEQWERVVYLIVPAQVILTFGVPWVIAKHYILAHNRDSYSHGFPVIQDVKPEPKKDDETIQPPY